MDEEKILVVDDEKDILDMMSKFLTERGYIVYKATCLKEAQQIGENENIDLAIIDLVMPDANGISVLKMLQKINSAIVGIIVTGFATIDSAVEAMKAGAFDYIQKPFNLEELLITIKKALKFKELQGENIYLKSQLKKKYKFDNFVGASESMLEVFKIIETVSNSDSTVLIYGESGTGKELAAKSIHYNSKRRDKYLVPVNCGAIPEDLLETELFGHVKGAFTGAVNKRIGRFEFANGGTIFLDEIGDMSLNLQVKLLRVLQEKEFTPVGGTEPIKVDVRVIAATNQNLEKAVEEKRFREDLYYRLNVIPLTIPPLRERKSDIPLLVEHFINQMRYEKGVNVKEVSDEVMEIFMEYDWPGNVRELENIIERMMIFSGDKERLTAIDLPEKFKKRQSKPRSYHIKLPLEGLNLKKIIHQIEDDLILQALERTGGVKEKAAQLLKMNRTTLVQKIKKRKLLNN
ncbi:MAG: sigma-54-dependent Fis family transcriptional regulator [Candidatus Schekmanbacteria bacterium]|nr:MAG: sigma-54-dependent Fis family transcriptional regulator [Candidatus Schekmanbacteria bacterium]